MDTRDSPVVEVSEEALDEYNNRQIGSRVRAALAHTPAEGLGNYHAIVVAKDRDAIDMSAEEVGDADYDTIINHQISPDDEWRAEIGRIVRERLEDDDSFILARS